MKLVSAEQPPRVAPRQTEGWGRFVRAFALDLAVSLVLVLAAVRLYGIVAGITPDNPWADQLRLAVTRFTPFGLWDIYSGQLRAAVAETAANPGSSIAIGMLFALRLLYDAAYAAVQTVGQIWQQTATLSDWFTLLGFSGILAISAVVLATGGGRLSVPRLLLAVLVSPLSAIGLFWLAQQTALDALDGFACYAAAAPWCLLCPVACTLYWVMFPGAEHSATVSALDALSRARLPGRRRRGLAEGVATATLTRHK